MEFRRPVPVEEILARVQERLTDKYFARFESKKIDFFIERGLGWVNDVGARNFTLDEVCSAGDPFADVVAWVAVERCAHHLYWTHLKAYRNVTLNTYQGASEISDEVKAEIKKLHEIWSQALHTYSRCTGQMLGEGSEQAVALLSASDPSYLVTEKDFERRYPLVPPKE